MGETRHQFHTTAGASQTLERLGQEVGEQAVQSVARSDENAAAGLREVRKYAQPVAEVLTAAGALAAVRGQAESLGKAAKAGAAAQKLIDAKEDVPVRLNMEEQWLLKKNHQQVEDMLLLREGIKDLGGIKIYKKVPAAGGGTAGTWKGETGAAGAGKGETGPFSGRAAPAAGSQSPSRQVLNRKATKKMEEFIDSPKFFDLRKRASVRAVTWYLQNSTNDVLHNMDVRHMSCRDLRRLLKADERNPSGTYGRASSPFRGAGYRNGEGPIGLSETDRAALRILLKHKGREKLRRQYSARMGFARQKAVLKLLRQVQNSQGDFGKGAAVTAAIYSAAGGAALFTGRTVLLTERFWKKHTRLGRLVGKGERFVLRKTGQGAAWIARQGGRGVRYAGREAAKGIRYVGGKAGEAAARAWAARRGRKALSGAGSTQAGKYALKVGKGLNGAIRGTNGGLLKGRQAPHRAVGRISAFAKRSQSPVAKIKAAAANARKAAQKIAAGKAAKRAQAAARALGKVGKTSLGTALMPFKLGRKVLGGIFKLFSGIHKWVLIGGGIIAIFYFVLVLVFNSVMNMEDEEQTLREHAIQVEDENWVGTTARELAERFRRKVDEAVEEGKTYDNYTLTIVDGAGSVLGYQSGKQATGDAEGRQAPLAGAARPQQEASPPIELAPNNAKDVIVAAYVMAGGDEAFNNDAAARDALVEDLWTLMNPPAEFVESEVYYCSGCQTGEDGSSYCPGHQDVDITIRVLFLSDLQAMVKEEVCAGLTNPLYQDELAAFYEDGGWIPGTDDNDNILWASNLYTGDWITLYGADPGSGGGYATGTALSADDIRAILNNTEMTEEAKLAISYALSKVGCAYNQDYHANTSVDIFDCSSLVYRAYRQVGIDISNEGIYTAAEELRIAERRGQIVGKAELRPGDLIFFATAGAAREGRYKGCGHVAIYAGEGKMVEAKGRLWGVTYSQLRTKGIVGISRPE